VALARSRPGALKCGSAGTGSSPHLSCALFNQMMGVDILHVPYKSMAPGIADLLAGHVDIVFTPPAGFWQHVEAGKLRALAVTSATRFALFPDLPTIAESGAPGYAILQWWGLVVPRGTPAHVIDAIEAGVQAVQKLPDVQATLAAQGTEADPMRRPAFAQLIDREIAQYRAIIESAAITSSD